MFVAASKKIRIPKGILFLLYFATTVSRTAKRYRYWAREKVAVACVFEQTYNSNLT